MEAFGAIFLNEKSVRAILEEEVKSKSVGHAVVSFDRQGLFASSQAQDISQRVTSFSQTGIEGSQFCSIARQTNEPRPPPQCPQR